MSDNENIEADLNSRALNLSLQYNFVTELTSLIVVADTNFTVDDNGQDANLEEEGGKLSPFAPTSQSGQNDISCKL